MPCLKKCTDFLKRAYGNLNPIRFGCYSCPYQIPSYADRGFHAIQPDFAIDVVYTWVDGTDAEHIHKRNFYQSKQSVIDENGIAQSRFRDNQELRFSLRSVEKYAPWVRNIILVTDQQCPDWIQTSHPKLRIVDHKEFIPNKYLPTFNSHVIEAYLHNIPGLAEHYIYFNDDFFLGRPCKKTDFFTCNGLPIALVDWRKNRISGYYTTNSPHAFSYRNTLSFLNEKNYPTNPKFILAHGPYAQLKINAKEAFEFYYDVMKQFSTNRFRTTKEIAMYCHAIPLWAYSQKKIVPCDERYFYVPISRKNRELYYKGILNSYKKETPPFFFCLNDINNSDLDPRVKSDMINLLLHYYPNPSTFEMSPYVFDNK